MFVKLLKKDSEEEIILNVDEISSITKALNIPDINNLISSVNMGNTIDITKEDTYEYLIRMANNSVLDIDEEQYNQLCEILMRRV